MNNQWLTIEQAVDKLGMSASTIRRRIKSGEFESKLDNGKRVILVDIDSQVTQSMTQLDMADYLQSEIHQLKQEMADLKDQLKQKDEDLRQKDEQMAEANGRHDTIILQFTRQLEQSQRLLEYHRDPFWRRWFRKKREENPS